MANYLFIFSAPDAHIDFLQKYPDSLRDYVAGRRPKIVPPTDWKPTFWQRLFGASPPRQPVARGEIPDDWPVSEPKMIGPNINHRNVDLYHSILNGTADYVDGSGSIFQTWFMAKHSAIDLTGEDYAFKSDQVPALLPLLSRVDRERVKAVFTKWLRKKSDSYSPTDDACDAFVEEFKAFELGVTDAVNRSHGLIWVCG